MTAEQQLARVSRKEKRYRSLTPPPYSPDLAPPDYLLFPNVKSNSKGRHFDTISNIPNNVTSESKRIPAAKFYGGIQKPHDRANRCMQLGRMYAGG